MTSGPQEHWFCEYVKSGREPGAGIWFATMGCPVMIPMYYEWERDKADKFYVPVSRGPLFPRYIFFKAREPGLIWGALRTQDAKERGCIATLHDAAGKPRWLRQSDLEKIKYRNEPPDPRPIKDAPKFAIGQKVWVNREGFEKIDGIVSKNAKDRVKVLLHEFMGQGDVSVDVFEAELEAA